MHLWKYRDEGTSPAGSVLKNLPSKAADGGSIPAGGANTLHAARQQEKPPAPATDRN